MVMSLSSARLAVTCKGRRVVVYLMLFAVFALAQPSAAQTFAVTVSPMNQGLVGVYTIYVDLFQYPYSLDSVQVSLYDQSGRLLGSASSLEGAEVAISFTTSRPVYSLTAKAFGLAVLGLGYSWFIIGTRTVNVGTGGFYWIYIYTWTATESPISSIPN